MNAAAHNDLLFPQTAGSLSASARLTRLSTTAYRRMPEIDSERFRKHWVANLGELRQELKFRILGYVHMPEHFHTLIWPAGEVNPSQIMQRLEDRTALLMPLQPTSPHLRSFFLDTPAEIM